MVHEGIVVVHLVSSGGIEVDQAKFNVITFLPYSASLQVFTGDSSRSLSRLPCHRPSFFKKT